MARSKKSKGSEAVDNLAVAETAACVEDKSPVATKGQNMSDSIISFSEDIATAEAPAPLPAGEYTAEIRSVEVKTSQKGNRFASVTFHIPADQYPADYDEGNPDGTTLTYNRLVMEDNQQSRHRIRKFCESIGAKMGREIDVSEWIGLSATVSVKLGEWEGEKRAEIDRVLSA